MKLLLLFIFLQISLLSTAQYSYADFNNEADLYKKAEIGAFLSNEYKRNDLDSLRIISSELIILASENTNPYSKSVGQIGLGAYFIRSGSVAKGIGYLKEGLSYFEEKEDMTNVSEILNEIGNGYTLSGEFTNAIQSYIASLDYGKLAEDETAYFNGEIGLAKAYFSLGDTVKGKSTILHYKDEALKFDKFEAIANAYAYIAMVEMDGGDIEQSLTYFDKSIEFGLKADSKLQLSHIYTNKAIVYFNLGEMDSSLVLFEKALKIRSLINRPRQTVEAHYNLASYYVEVEEYTPAIIQLNESIRIARQNNLLVDEYDGLELLKEIFENLEDDKKVNDLDEEMKLLKLKLESKQEVDDDLIDYIENLGENTKVDSEVKKSETIRYTWVLILAFIGILSIRLYLKKQKMVNIEV